MQEVPYHEGPGFIPAAGAAGALAILVGLVVLGHVDLGGARRYHLSEVPSGSLPALLATGTALTLQRLVLPAIHWMNDTRPFGILRPRTSGNGNGP